MNDLLISANSSSILVLLGLSDAFEVDHTILSDRLKSLSDSSLFH